MNSQWQPTKSSVKLIDHMGSDASVIAAMLVSTKGEQSLEELFDAAVEKGEATGATKGRLNFLMRDKHGCYDDETEVLTDAGWVAFPAIDGSELFATLNLDTNAIQYQKASRLIRRDNNGDPMIRIGNEEVDFLVTPEHRMIVQNENGSKFFKTAIEILESELLSEIEDIPYIASCRVPITKNEWSGTVWPRVIAGYCGQVHCVTVPNGTLYVRRNGKAAWCGNSPFEHNAMTFFVEAPIFVFREWHRHRHMSYNEASGRYMELEGKFYIPDPDRKLVQVGKPGAYEFVEGTPEQYDLVTEQLKLAYDAGWSAYQTMLGANVAKEVARMALNLGLFSQMHVTCNARSLMHFLSLRTNEPTAKFPSKPQWEIEECARMLETEFARLFPITYDVYCANGRVAP